MERVVGATLILLAGWLALSIAKHLRGGEKFRMQSRWMALISLYQKGWLKLRDKVTGQTSRDITSKSYGPATSFVIGIAHGIGAETGTQVLLIAAIGGAASHGLGTAMLFSFIAGLLCSNTVVALLATTSFASAKKSEAFYLAAGALTCVFSLVVGTYFMLGQGDLLPDLKTAFWPS